MRDIQDSQRNDLIVVLGGASYQRRYGTLKIPQHDRGIARSRRLEQDLAYKALKCRAIAILIKRRMRVLRFQLFNVQPYRGGAEALIIVKKFRTAREAWLCHHPDKMEWVAARLQLRDSGYGAIMTARPVSEFSIPVMQIAWTIQANPHCDLVLFEQIDPGVVN